MMRSRLDSGFHAAKLIASGVVITLLAILCFQVMQRWDALNVAWSHPEVVSKLKIETSKIVKK